MAAYLVSTLVESWQAVQTYVEYNYSISLRLQNPTRGSGEERSPYSLDELLNKTAYDPFISNLVAENMNLGSPPEYSIFDSNLSASDPMMLVPSYPKRNRFGWPLENVALNWPYRTMVSPGTSHTSIYWTRDDLGRKVPTTAGWHLEKCGTDIQELHRNLKRLVISQHMVCSEKLSFG
ncbi:uncharacterized protein LY89DRAFT_226377 [Mollisia scopiformis]|uniref:Uncharacterized protein n=1 Tax=Mollisia scopiformis TaxID=149040 RepID=A0A194WU57_MOLSC|nr:uncharacterized protein LY89DRAFT_226377 [Mollisia scopiformis]KUJ11493.1 hypothetical protein LY89DRAFT_226377 [Mollisia scopiformis]